MTRGLSVRIPIYFTAQWRSVSFSVGGSLGVDGWGDDRSYAGVSYGPWVTVGFGPVMRVWSAWWRWISLGQEQAPADDREPIANIPKRIQTISATHDELHYYRIRGIICFQSDPACDDIWAKTVFDHVNSNDIPFTDDDERVGEHHIGPFDSPITHEELDGELATKNTTKLDHPFHLGIVTHRVHFENDALVYDVVGEGEGKSPRIKQSGGDSALQTRCEGSGKEV